MTAGVEWLGFMCVYGAGAGAGESDCPLVPGAHYNKFNAKKVGCT